MSDSPSLPPRPGPARRPVDNVAAWLAWFGFGRLVVSAMCVVIVGAGVFWLVRTPTPPPETGLPFAGGGVSSVPAATLAPPPVPTTQPSAGHAAVVVVHVAGSVTRPGVYQLAADDRVDAAIAAAGGPTDDADLDGLNLAAVVLDGQRIYVPIMGEVDPSAVPSGPSPVASVADTADAAGPIDLNTATAEQLQTLPGVGPATATAIVGDRERNGPFASVADLERVPGIGPAKMAALQGLVTV